MNGEKSLSWNYFRRVMYKKYNTQKEGTSVIYSLFWKNHQSISLISTDGLGIHNMELT